MWVRVSWVMVACVLMGAAASVLNRVSAEDNWPQFRGINGSGRAAVSRLPTMIGPEKNVIWKTELPPGHSSPVVFGDRVYVTAERGEKLLTIAIDRRDGRIVWELEAPHDKLETIHSIGSHAQASPTTDGERVVSFFGSCGLFCYDRDGKLLWRRPMGPFNNDFGAGTSPILVDDWVLLGQDHDTDSFLMAIDKRTGNTIWKTDRTEFARNYCTPVIWEVAGRKQIVMAATLKVVGYDFATGQELWRIGGVSRTVCMSPVIGDDGNLYVAGWSAGGDADDRVRVAPFDQVAPGIDKNKNGLLEEDELEDSPLKQRFSQVDRDNDNALSKAEYEFFRDLFEQSRNVVLAIKPGAVGDATETHVLWRHEKQVPFCASPLYFAGHVFTIKDGGILSSLDAATGKPGKVARVPATGEYYSSPVAGDGKVFLLNQKGQLTVVSAEGEWRVLHSADFGEEAYATPALVGGRIYLRTNGHLYCLGLGE